MDGDIGGITSGDEEGGGLKKEGVTKSVECLALESGVSIADIIALAVNKFDVGIWIEGTETRCGREVETTGAVVWYGCAGIAVFGAPPIFIAVCIYKSTISSS